MLTADERLALIRLKIERAKKHVLDLNDRAGTFFASKPNPYEVTCKRDPQTRRLIYYLARVEPVPTEIAVIAGDALHCLRSSLDYLAWNLVEIGQASLPAPLTVTEQKRIGFPIIDTDSPTEYEASRRRKVKGMRQAAIDAIDATKPYKGGNDTLWRLGQLNNIDKHRLLITVSSGYHAFNSGPFRFRDVFKDDPVLGKRQMEIPSLWLFPTDRQCPLKVGDELLADLPDAEFNEEIQFSFIIALSEPQIIECEPILPFLGQMVDYVDNLILSFKPLLS